MEHEEISVEHGDVKLHNPYIVKEYAQVVNEDEETKNDCLLVRDGSIRVIKPPYRLSYADLITFSLISASEVLDE